MAVVQSDADRVRKQHHHQDFDAFLLDSSTFILSAA